MAPEQQQRQLAVILHADIEGSTALVRHDETLAHERITDAFNRFSQTIERYGGRAHEVRGDALVAEFARASVAVCAALAFQRSQVTHQAELSDEIATTIRIGISLGEVVFADDTVTGAGVVLAQRVEQLAEPDGVCITAAIHEAVPERMPFDQESLGEQEVKRFRRIRACICRTYAGWC
jgi:class 3 adenylate cyclase